MQLLGTTHRPAGLNNMERPSPSSSAGRTPSLHWLVSHYAWDLSDAASDWAKSLKVDFDWRLNYYCRYFVRRGCLDCRARLYHHDPHVPHAPFG